MSLEWRLVQMALVLKFHEPLPTPDTNRSSVGRGEGEEDLASRPCRTNISPSGAMSPSVVFAIDGREIGDGERRFPHTQCAKQEVLGRVLLHGRLFVGRYAPPYLDAPSRFCSPSFCQEVSQGGTFNVCLSYVASLSILASTFEETPTRLGAATFSKTTLRMG